MQHSLSGRYFPLLRQIDAAELQREIAQPRRLLIETTMAGKKRISVAYAPFDYVNHRAMVIVVGLTPGLQQMRNASTEAHRHLHQGATVEDALAAAKAFASFSGPMRRNLIALLDYIGVADLLGLNTTEALWNGDASLVHFTSEPVNELGSATISRVTAASVG